MNRIVKSTITLLGAAVLAAGIFGIPSLTSAKGSGTVENAVARGTIADGVYIGSVDVSGMTEDEAKAAVENFVSNMKTKYYTLKGPAKNIILPGSKMGIEVDTDAAVADAEAVGKSGNLIARFKAAKDMKNDHVTVDMHLKVDRQTVAEKIYEYADLMNVTMVANTVEKDGDSFTYVPGVEGQEINVVDSVYAIEDFLANSYAGTNTGIEMSWDTIEPEGSEEELKKIQDCLGSFTTDYSSSGSGRAQNVENGCSKINGTILYPGDSFSVYKTVSPFSEENGYELAGSYSNGTVVETFGGGICQVSTTLYNAVIRAELEVTMRYNHSMLVSYVEPSDDAAIAGEEKDLRFVNTTDAPVYLDGYCSNGKITFNIYGEETRPENREVSFESETLSTSDPITNYSYDSTLALGTVNVTSSTHQGVSAQLWKIVTVDGVEESREVFNRSDYSPQPRTVVIGTKGATSSQISELQSAAAADDESKVESLAYQFAVANSAAASSAASSSESGSSTNKNGSTGGSSTGGSSTGGSSTGGSSTGGSSTGGSTGGGTTGDEGTDGDGGVVEEPAPEV